jgi:acyl-CoA thioester hydrolase
LKLSIKLPVQFRDIDVMGHVNHATYLQYMETARVELARRLGQRDQGFRSSFIVAMAHCEYKKPILHERSVTVSTWVTRIGDRSWDLDYTVRSPSDTEYAIGRTTQVSFDYEKRRPIGIPVKLRKELKTYSGKPLKFRGTGENQK